MGTLKEIGAQILHAALGFVVCLFPALWPDFPGTWAVSALLTGLLREDSQHRKHFDKTPEGWAWIIGGNFPIGGRWRDIWAFGVGGLCAGFLAMSR